LALDATGPRRPRQRPPLSRRGVPVQPSGTGRSEEAGGRTDLGCQEALKSHWVGLHVVRNNVLFYCLHDKLSQNLNV
jgi:hypothetical protein